MAWEVRLYMTGHRSVRRLLHHHVTTHGRTLWATELLRTHHTIGRHACREVLHLWVHLRAIGHCRSVGQGDEVEEGRSEEFGCWADRSADEAEVDESVP
ncbi:hypothetical protein KCU83_g84, partial [Aureobasidium melanogenum]